MAVVCIDTDYYVESWDYYLGSGAAAMLHTFAPRKVAGRDGDSFYRVIDDVVQYDVSGGSSWKHEVWDWTAHGEFLEFEASSATLDWWQYFCSYFLSKKVYSKVIFSRPWDTCPDRALVWIVPQFSCWQLRGVGTEMHARRLKRMKFSDSTRPGWNSLIHVNDAEPRDLMINLGLAGADASVTLRKCDYDVLMLLKSAQSVTTRCLGMGITIPAEIALVQQYYSGVTTTLPEPPRLGAPCRPLVHWPVTALADVPDTSARVYSPPLVSDSNMMPMVKRWEALSLSITRRVTYHTNTKTPNISYGALASEFAQQVVPNPGNGLPYDVEQTADMLSKPSQALMVRQVWETLDMPHRELIECFLKNEPTMKAGRIISSFPDMRNLLGFSRYTLSFRDNVLHDEHNKHWFCPGQTPTQLASTVVEYVRSVVEPVEGDFSNFDGSVSEWLQRNVMSAVYFRYFGLDPALQKYCDALVSCPARAKRFNFKYEAGVGVKSGSPTTCDLNSVLNAFTQYCAIRKTVPELDPAHAFHSIGLAFGDDSLFEQQYMCQWAKVCKQLGLTIKAERYDATQGITFLARVFPDPLNTTTSFQDPLRTWRKLHVTTRDPNIPLPDAAVDRVEGYLVADALSPVTAAYCSMIVRTNVDKLPAADVRKKRASANREKPYWYSSEGGWPQDKADVDIMREVTASRTGLTVEELRLFEDELKQCKDPWTMSTINRDENAVPYVDTVGPNGELYEAVVDQRKYLDDVQTVIKHATGKPAENKNKDDDTTRAKSPSRRPENSGRRDRSRTLRRDGPPPGTANQRIEGSGQPSLMRGALGRSSEARGGQYHVKTHRGGLPSRPDTPTTRRPTRDGRDRSPTRRDATSAGRGRGRGK